MAARSLSSEASHVPVRVVNSLSDRNILFLKVVAPGKALVDMVASVHECAGCHVDVIARRTRVMVRVRELGNMVTTKESWLKTPLELVRWGLSFKKKMLLRKKVDYLEDCLLRRINYKLFFNERTT